jgi:hypothetical protein
VNLLREFMIGQFLILVNTDVDQYANNYRRSSVPNIFFTAETPRREEQPIRLVMFTSRLGVFAVKKKKR